jgi:hypothetical protein
VRRHRSPTNTWCGLPEDPHPAAGLDAKLVAKDACNDLAPLRVEGASLFAMKFRSGKAAQG